jgi:hypothetical protein
VQRLAAHSRVRVAIPRAGADHRASNDRIVIAAIAGAVVLLFLAGLAVRRLLARR